MFFRQSKSASAQRVSYLALFFCLIAVRYAFGYGELPRSSVTASSSSGGYVAAKAIDNNTSTYWQGGSGSSWWLKIDLGRICNLTTGSIWWNKDYEPYSYEIQGSKDNSNWTRIISVTSGSMFSRSSGKNKIYQRGYNLSGAWRYLRIYITRAKIKAPSIYEVKFYGDIDVAAPQVSITSPQNGVTIAGAAEILTQISDNIAVAKAEFYVNGVLKLTDSMAPYTYFWDTAGYGNGDHVIKVIAYDTSNNSTQAQVSIKVSNISTDELTISNIIASSFYGSYPAAKAGDKNISTYWRGAGTALSKPPYWWLNINLGKSLPVSKISIFWHKDHGSTSYQIQGSANGAVWTNLYSGLSSAGGSVNPCQKDYALSGSYRYIRIYIAKAQKIYPMIYEVKLFGANKILSINVEPKEWNIGAVKANKVVTMSSANKIRVTNNGNTTETFELKLVNPAGWNAAGTAGNEAYVLSGLFCGYADTPAEAHFNQGAPGEDIITTGAKKATAAVFGFSSAAASGEAVPAGENRALYLQFKSPVVTKKSGEQQISVIVTCQTP